MLGGTVSILCEFATFFRGAYDNQTVYFEN